MTTLHCADCKKDITQEQHIHVINRKLHCEQCAKSNHKEDFLKAEDI